MLEPFHSATRAWFERTFPAPTDIQSKAWPAIARGEHVLIHAPTGSGKTLTAFLWAIDQLARGTWEPGAVRVLYVSPLRALNRDIGVNLLEPIEGLGANIRVGVRSGDTEPAERRRQIKHPPEILVTTPETLNVLLTSHGGRRILHGVQCVILDEIHAVADSKRGTYLMTAVERLTELSGEFQRIALSATVHPDVGMPMFVGGPGRDVRTITSNAPKEIVLDVRPPPEVQGPPWEHLAAEFRTLALGNRSTLFFVNNRALAERLARLMNEAGEEPIAYAHHGSLAPQTRRLVEERLKRGELRAIVATNSLELGIDIGSLDEVVLVQPPRTAHSGIQRVGRAGHQVGAPSRGRLYPIVGREWLDAEVLRTRIESRAVEPFPIPRAPLDVLAQVVVAMTAVEERTADELFALLRRTGPYRELARASFDRVLAMLDGRYADTRLRELKPRVRADAETGRLRAVQGSLPLLWQSGGVIPDRGYFQLRIQGTPTRLGELDEEFVWERKKGDIFVLGSTSWRVKSIRRNEVEVTAAGESGRYPPFWRAEAQPRDFDLCQDIGRFLEECEQGRPVDPKLQEVLDAQREATGCALPHRHHVVVEHPHTTSVGGDGQQVIIHAPWGGRVLRAFEIALAGAWDVPVETFSNDDCILVTLPGGMSAAEIFRTVTVENVEKHLRSQLERTGFFAARFRENAQRALLLPRRGRERTPLWLNRMRSQKLFEAVLPYEDFPILAETWRTCLEDELDLPNLRTLLSEIESGAIAVSEVRTSSPSPFADGVGWRSVNEYVYRGDQAVGSSSNLSDAAIEDALQDARLRPRLEHALVRELESKLQRTAPGYEPETEDEWRDHVESCLLVSPWTDELPPGLGRLGPWVVSERQRERIEAARAGDAGALVSCLAEQLRFRTVVTAGELREAWGVPVEAALAELVESGKVIADRLLVDATEIEYCEVENLERLLRLARRAHRVDRPARPASELGPYLAAYQGVGRASDLPSALEPLLGYVAPAAQWEESILPARVTAYRGADLDALFVESDLLWFGRGKERSGFSFPDELPLLLDPVDELPEPFPSRHGRFDFFDLPGADRSAELAARLWELTFDGRATNDTFAALRQGIENRFKPAAPKQRRRGFRSWQASRPLVGAWRPLMIEAAADELDELERDKERARLLLQRYGVLTRALLRHELPLLGWGRLQRALRLMELSGEVIGGHFFEGLEGLQFATPDFFGREIHRGCYWIQATDPASPCGLGLDYPARVASTWLVFDDGRLALTVRRNGAELAWHVDPRPEHFALFDAWLGRGFRPRRRIEVETVTGADPRVLEQGGFYEERGRWYRESGSSRPAKI
ncbi:MAG: DEAD/DEAH box helicase [Planctomycetota bacterium]